MKSGGRSALPPGEGWGGFSDRAGGFRAAQKPHGCRIERPRTTVRWSAGAATAGLAFPPQPTILRRRRPHDDSLLSRRPFPEPRDGQPSGAGGADSRIPGAAGPRRAWMPAAAARRGSRSRGSASRGCIPPATCRKSGRWPSRAAGSSTPIPWSAPARTTWPCMAAGAAATPPSGCFGGEDRRALCLVRPPGHHAMADRGMGFCLFNNVAVAARMALDEFHLDRVLVVDWDVHHGNGTQAAFWEEPRVGLPLDPPLAVLSGHGRSGRDRRRARRGNEAQSAHRVRHAAAGVSRPLRRRAGTFAAKIKPQLVLLSAGFDAHRLDPVGNLGLETEDYRPADEPRARRRRRLCRRQGGQRARRAATTRRSWPSASRCTCGRWSTET